MTDEGELEESGLQSRRAETDGSSGRIDDERATEGSGRLLTDGGEDDAKIIGKEDGDGGVGVYGEATGTGETYGIWGQATSADGYGLGTPDDARVDGLLEGTEITASNEEFSIRGHATASGEPLEKPPTDVAVGVEGATDRNTDETNVDDAIGVFGNSIATSGLSIGVVGRTESPDGIGVLGNSIDEKGTAVFSNGNCAVDGDLYADGAVTTNTLDASTAATDTGATAVEGEATDTTTENYGVAGTTQSEDDYAAGVLGVAEATSGMAQGVRGVAENGIAVEATNNGESGFQIGLWANIQSDAGDAIQALASATSGSTSGVHGRCNSADGAGVHGRGEAISGDAIGVLGTTDSPDGYGVYSEDDTRSDGMIEAGDGVVHEQRGEPTTSELGDGDVMTYNSDGSDGHSAGDLVYAINDGGTILTQVIAAKNDAS